jgi:hypothetical protein
MTKNFSKLKTFLTDFEQLLNKSELTTDEVSDLSDKIVWLQEVLTNKESEDD